MPPILTSPRDLKGYGAHPPSPEWPNGARVAISIVMNVEAGAELSIDVGDERNEAVYEIVEPVEGIGNTSLASHFGYGPRAGYWRIVRVLDEFGATCTVNAAGRSIEHIPWLAADAVARGFEMGAHGYRWEGHSQMDLKLEREVIAKTISAIENAAGVRPYGWHTKGATSRNTRYLLAKEFGFLYDSDAYDDDLPYVVDVDGRSQVIMPYAFDTNDMRFMAGGTFIHAEDFSRYCIEAFDWLWREGANRPAMMSIGIHPRLIGRPGRIGGLERFLQHVTNKGDVWIARRLDIARHWRKLHGLGD